MILIVDDNPMLRTAYEVFLASLGHTVLTASGGAEALEYLRRGARPALILLDLSMPDMTGWEFRAAQQADPELDRIPVIVLSAEALSAADISHLGCCGVLRKPSPAETITAALDRGRQCIAARAAGRRLPTPARLTAKRPSRPKPGSYTASCGRGL